MIRFVQRLSRACAAVVLMSVVLAGPASGATSSPGGPSGGDAARPELQRLLDAVVAAGAPGAVALINDGQAHGSRDPEHGHGNEHGVGDGVWTGTSGVADVRTRRPIGAGDRFRVASVTKPFVATVVLELVAEHRLSLEDSVERWLPGTLPYGDQITVRQLLNHTSGVPDYVLAPLLELYGGHRLRSWRPQELVALVADRPADFPAGTGWSYSNTNYVLAGLIIERVTGNRLGHELQRRIFRPLRLRHTWFPTDFPFLIGRHARGYSLQLDGDLNPIEGPLFDITDYNPSVAWSAGAIVSDVGDLARFFRALLGGRLLPADLLAEMKTPIEIAPGLGYGLGLLVSDSPCGRLFGHDGGIPGYSNTVLNSEDGKHQLAVMTNASVPPAAVAEPLDLTIARAVREAFAGEPCAAAPPGGEVLRQGQISRMLHETGLGHRRAQAPATRG